MLVKLFKFFLSQGLFGLFVLMFLEGNPFVGYFISGQIVLFTAGILASLGYFSLKTMLLISILGSFIGDIFSFILGRILFPNLKINRTIVSKMNKLVKGNSVKVVVLGKLISVTRAFTPYLCGKSKMEFWKFAIANLLASLLWCGTSVIIGYKFGTLIFSSYSLVTKILIILISLLVLMYLFYLALSKIYTFSAVKEYFLFNYVIISALLFSILFINRFKLSINYYHFYFLNFIRIPFSVFIILTPPIIYLLKNRKKLVLFFVNFIFYIIYAVLASIFMKHNHLILPYSIILIIEYSFFYFYNVFRTCSIYSFFIFFILNLFLILIYILVGYNTSRVIVSVILAGVYIEILLIFTRTWFNSSNTS